MRVKERGRETGIGGADANETQGQYDCWPASVAGGMRGVQSCADDGQKSWRKSGGMELDLEVAGRMRAGRNDKQGQVTWKTMQL